MKADARAGGGTMRRTTQIWPPKVKPFALLPNPSLAMPHVWLDVKAIAEISKKVRVVGLPCPWAPARRPRTSGCL